MYPAEPFTSPQLLSPLPAPKGRMSSLLSKFTPKRIMLSGLVTLVAVGLVQVIIFCWPRTVSFSYAADTCISNPMLLPETVKVTDNPQFRVQQSPSFSLANYPIYSHTTCITPTQAPKAGASTTLILKGSNPLPLQKELRIVASTPPQLQQKPVANKLIPAKTRLYFNLNQHDNVYWYRLAVGEQTQWCTLTAALLSCDTTNLNLTQSTTYELRLERMYGTTYINTILTQPITTIDAVKIVSTSITPGQEVQSTPTNLTLTTNKTLASLDGTELYLLKDGNKEKLATTARVSGNTINIEFTKALPRSSSFELVVKKVMATDQAFLPEAYVLPFRTSGGPKVTGTNIGSNRSSNQPRIVINFDANIAPDSATNFVRVEKGGAAVAATVSISGNSVTITPNQVFGRCERFSVRVLDGIKNEFGVSGSSAWQFNSRVTCQTTFSIGTSVQGRSITAYRFGTGASTIVYVGTTHGDEKSSKYTLDSWINELETNYDQIPAHRTIVVIPNLNPDAFAASRRTNARNVDLNRNFPANNWKSAVTMPDKSLNPTGGGTSALSEPESAALASYIASVQPRLVLTYHAIAGVVIPNGSGDSVSLAQNYDRASNVGYSSNDSAHEIFEYDTTGAFEDWLHDKQSTPALLVELWTHSHNEFNNHRAAMWNMAKL